MSNNPFLQDGHVNPFASSSSQGGITTTFSKFGKLSLASVVPCTRCKSDHTPKSEWIRRHNRSELTQLLCDACTKRNNELIAASASLMVAKGGFPPTLDQLLEAFYVRDEALEKGTDDPFEDVRITYLDDPLCEDDVAYWIGEKLFSFNRANSQLECMIDRVLEDPERALLLGKAGLAGKTMAKRRAERLAAEKANPNPQLNRPLLRR